MSDLLISSPQNPKVKQLLALQNKSSERRRSGLFVVEGRRELRRCIEGGYNVESVFVCSSPQMEGVEPMPQLPSDVVRYEVTPQLYEKMAYRGGTEGVIAIVRSRGVGLADLPVDEHALLVVLEGVEKPGNVGAVLRSADAAGATAVILCDAPTDLYNPNLIRASVGAFFSVPCVCCSTAECIAFLKQRGIRILTAQLQDSQLYYSTDMRMGTAIVFGTEATGLTDPWRQAADSHIRIPMLGQVDSLNVSVSAAILLYEAVRQRQS